MTACGKCGGTGWYRYDHNHSMVCPGCCPHDQGVWMLTHHYRRAGAWWSEDHYTSRDIPLPATLLTAAEMRFQ